MPRLAGACALHARAPPQAVAYSRFRHGNGRQQFYKVNPGYRRCIVNAVRVEKEGIWSAAIPTFPYRTAPTNSG